jgi:hypothetical protein
MPFLGPISRCVYNALQLKLVQNSRNPLRGVRAANFQASYSLSRFVNPLAFAGNTPALNPVSVHGQEFVVQAADNDDPLKFMGPSLLDRTHQFFFGGSLEVPYSFRVGVIAHFYSRSPVQRLWDAMGLEARFSKRTPAAAASSASPCPEPRTGRFNAPLGVAPVVPGFVSHREIVL